MARLPPGDCRVSASHGDARAPDRQPVGDQVLCRHGAALNPFPEGSLVRERPGGAGGMGVHMPNRPDADRGMPRWGVAPSHGLDGRIGIAPPAGRGATAGAPATCGIGVVHAGNVASMHKQPRSVMYTRGSASARASGAQNGSPGSRGERDTVKPSIIAPKGAARKRQPEQCGHGPTSHPPSRNRRCGPARDHADGERHPRHGRRGGCGSGRLPGLPPPDRRDEGTAPIGPPRRNDRRPFGLAFEPLRRRRDLTARGDGPLPIRKRTSTSGSMCTGSAVGCDTPPMPQVAVVVAFVRQPEAWLCRAGEGGRDRSDPPPWTLGVPRGRVGMCRPSQPSTGGRSGPAIPCGKTIGESVRFRAAVATGVGAGS